MKAITDAYERRLWEELNSLLVQVVPEGASAEDAERAIMLALIGHDVEIADLFERIRRLARTERGCLRERMQEDNPVATIERRIQETAASELPNSCFSQANSEMRSQSPPSNRKHR